MCEQQVSFPESITILLSLSSFSFSLSVCLAFCSFSLAFSLCLAASLGRASEQTFRSKVYSSAFDKSNLISDTYAHSYSLKVDPQKHPMTSWNVDTALSQGEHGQTFCGSTHRQTMTVTSWNTPLEYLSHR